MSGLEQVKVKGFPLLDYSHSSVSSLLDVIQSYEWYEILTVQSFLCNLL